MRLKYDLTVGALYIRLTDEPVARTREVDDNTAVDLDADGGVVGIEVVSIEHPWPLDDILRQYEIPAGETAQLRSYFQPDGLVALAELPAVSQDMIPAVSMEPNAPVRVAA